MAEPEWIYDKAIWAPPSPAYCDLIAKPLDWRDQPHWNSLFGEWRTIRQDDDNYFRRFGEWPPYHYPNLVPPSAYLGEPIHAY